MIGVPRAIQRSVHVNNIVRIPHQRSNYPAWPSDFFIQRLAPDKIVVEFDEFNLNAVVQYSGLTPILAEAPPTAEELSTEAGIAALSGYMIRGYADRVRIKQRDQLTRIQLHFDH